MNILALETIDLSASVTLLENDREKKTILLPSDQRSTQTLVPAVGELLAAEGWQPEEVDVVALAQGPGSFTGLRVGMTFAKTFAYAAGAKLVALNTLEVIAQGTPSEFQTLSVILDAQRNELVTEDFHFQEGKWRPISEMRLLPWEEWLQHLSPDMAVTGPILRRKAKQLPADVIVVPERFWHPSTVVLGQMAYEKSLRGEFSDLWNTLPFYSRLAAAEERKKSLSTQAGYLPKTSTNGRMG
ncbi:MAG: tRNA (adenosine(37)-N6)-threonylcarbamoyltransferase complex dimerization subunit type 1 TsaB [Planctomycetia bacterium]|nr:tRNA (adenosine(37)-N6)-threonylcarbamoyltransferase complex dimerization subunit type 1 TsaB [Planctomycetia bacterium]